MDYMTLKEAAEKWGVTPKTAEKPIDGRTKQGKEQKRE
mgnify:CR=1 FL=1